MLNSVQFKTKKTVNEDNYSILTILFSDWIDTEFNNRARYKTQRIKNNQTTFNVTFKQQEDVVVLLLRGLPENFKRYLEIVTH